MNITAFNNSIVLLSRLFDCKKPTVPIITWKSEKPTLTPSHVSSPLKRITPEEAGIPSETIAAFLRDIKNDISLNMHTILFVKNGCVIAEAEFDEYDMDIPKYVFSASKSVTALAIGMLIDEGRLSADEKLIDIFAEKLNPISKLKLRDITVETLLTMKSCVVFNELGSMTVTNWQETFINSSIRGNINKDFNYNSLNTYMLAAIIKKKTGKTVCEYLAPRLFEPLDIQNYYWEKSPEGIEKGGWGLYIRPEDFAKIAIMVQDGGVWHDKRLISSTWLENALSSHAVPPTECGDFNYGYQIWSGRRANTFLFNGMLGQNVLCFRSSGLIIVSNAGNDESFQQSNYFNYVLKHFGKPFDRPCTPNQAASDELSKLLYEIKHPAFPGQQVKKSFFEKLFRIKSHDAVNDFLGVSFESDDDCSASASLMPTMLQAVENNYSCGFSSFIIYKGNEHDRYSITLAETDEVYTFTAGKNEYVRQTVCFHGQSFLIASSVRAAKNEDGNSVLTLDVLFLETPFRRQIKAVLADNPKLIFTESPGADFSMGSFKTMINDFSKNPIIGSLLDNDICRNLINGLFNKTLCCKIKKQ